MHPVFTTGIHIRFYVDRCKGGALKSTLTAEKEQMMVMMESSCCRDDEHTSETVEVLTLREGG